MKITVESTTKVVKLNGVDCRIWEGATESGIAVHCFISRVATKAAGEDVKQFERELQEQQPPSAEMMAIPARLIL